MFSSLILLVLSACTPERRIEGQVVDTWGEPVEGATVVMEGQNERPLTDRNGRFTLPWTPGKQRLKAGREGYIQEHVEIEVVDGAADAPHPVFQLYPKPEKAGFYLVGPDKYIPLEPQPIAQVGNSQQAVHGIAEVGADPVQLSSIRIVFHTPLKIDQVMRLGLQMHRLDFVAGSEMVGPLGPEQVNVNLWTSAEAVETRIKPLRSRDDYLIETEGTLAPGDYAFDTQGMLVGRDAAAFTEIPEPLRVAYTMSLR